MKTAQDAFRTFYEDTFARLSKKGKAGSRMLKKEPNEILRPFREDMADLNEGGKMLRGVLVCLGCRIAGDGDGSGADDLALALEIFQTGVLIHDDLIDRARLRRGKKTIHTRYAESLKERHIRTVSDGDSLENTAAAAAVCAGDFLLYQSNLKIVEAYRGRENLADILSAYDRIVLDTIRGELLDVVLPCESQERDSASLKESIFDIYHLKTAQYSVVGPLHLGMLLGGASPSEMKQLDSFAEDLGVAFQIKDDILGIYAEEKELGKDVGSDISEFKQTILYAYVKNHDETACRKLMKYYGRAGVTQKDLEAVRKVFTDSGAYDFAAGEMNRLLQRASRKLARLSFVGQQEKEILEGFIRYSGERRR